MTSAANIYFDFLRYYRRDINTVDTTHTGQLVRCDYVHFITVHNATLFPTDKFTKPETKIVCR
jgi:hypothetical protein